MKENSGAQVSYPEFECCPSNKSFSWSQFGKLSLLASFPRFINPVKFLSFLYFST